MIRTLRALFLARLFREKILLVAFAVLGVVMWFSGFSTRVGTFWREQRSTTISLAEQKQWLANRVAIDASAQKAAARLDASQTLDATRLYAEVDKLARAAGVFERQLYRKLRITLDISRYELLPRSRI